ncbi:wall-associated receptor kinase-like 20 [Pistacia vera]|uniref:wall-associated receptor kinase-like 20 n=1 Tax=Pistacia vera TaxID=55513 RepID=UPI001263D775|nr:wall-associated receptor kinase-like 20 [Pistacia vera]
MKRSVLKILILIVTLLSCTTFASAVVRCGNCGRTPVPYPLSTDPNCGDQAYKIRCTAGTLWFDALNKSSYMITDINPLTQRIIIRPAGLSGKTCIASDMATEGIQLDDNLPFNITSSNTILLLNCSDAMLHLQAPINCSSNSICHDYINNNAPLCKSTSLCCVFKTGGSQNSYVVKVHINGGCAAYQSFVNLDTHWVPTKTWPAPAMELEWGLPQEPTCKLPIDCKPLLHSKCLVDPMNSGQKRCFCNAGFDWDPVNGLCRREKCPHGRGCKHQKKQTMLIAGMVATLGGISLAVMIVVLVLKQNKRMKQEAQKNIIREREEMLRTKNNGKSSKIFSGKEIIKATNNFSKDNLIGSGGFGEVFKGILDDGTITAIKRAKLGNTKGTDQVLNEVRILCQVNHRCLVRLLGCCVELDQPLLVYEYIPNGTLFDHLHCYFNGKWAPLPWHLRLFIAHQTAEGLAYLHSAAVPPIYHRDVKSSNILLDEKLNAKVSDFGLSRLVEISENNDSHIFTTAQGTLGYLDPEYYLNFQLTDKSDVYSFGVVLLELLTSKRAIDFNREEENVNLVVYMKKIIDEERLMDAVDPVLKEKATNLDLETIKALGLLAAACLDERRQNRPSMKEVADEIEYIISVAKGKVSAEG